MIPDYLYHYTNIEALALILKNKTIRFSPLNHMDDLQETESADVHNIGQIIYKSIILQLPFHDNSNGQPAKSLIPISDMISKKFYCPEAFLGKENLYKVLYTADRDKLLPRIVTGDKLQFALAIGNIGIYKNIKWKFQREWRYRLTLCPIDFDKPYNEMQKEYTIMANKLRDGFDVQSVPYYDMKLDDHAFQNMEIVMSPRLNEANRTILNEKFF